MKFRAYGEVKDTKTGQPINEANLKLYLNQEELQQGKSAKNGFYELIADIDDSRIESGQQMRVTFEKEGYQMQEHRVLATEGSFNLDVSLEAATPPPTKPFNWLPVIIAGGALLVLLVGGAVAWLLMRPKPPKIISFVVDPNSIEVGQSATLRWETEKASSVKIDPNPGVEELSLSGDIQVQPAQNTDYTLTAANEKGEISKTQSLEVKDIARPELIITTDPQGPTTQDRAIKFTASAKDSGGISSVKILVDEKVVKECPNSPCEYEKQGPFSAGSIKYRAIAYDKTGNETATDSKSLKIVDKTKPRVSIVLDPFSPNPTERIKFTANASDAVGISRVEIAVNGEIVKTCTGSPCSFIGGPYGIRGLRYEAYAYDNEGNKNMSGSENIELFNFDFESGDLKGWDKSGNAFDYQPTYEDNPTLRGRGQPSRHQGKFWIGTYEKHPSRKYRPGSVQGDGPRGTLTSKAFIIRSPKASFLVGGGSGRGVAVQLIVDDNVVLEARGKNNETMQRVNWDLSKHLNKKAKLRIVDKETGGWGHINFDDFRFESKSRVIAPIQRLPVTPPLRVLPR